MKIFAIFLLIINFSIALSNASGNVQESTRKDIKTADLFVERYKSEKKGMPTKKYSSKDELKYQEYKKVMDQKDTILEKAYSDATKKQQ
ncbi:MAG: hypothetical protein HQK53_20425 [Oligoflexia bacterium]|nr:hypothetical protein [Oligoflexia bacterium]